jgi:hypothetical protein
VNKVLFFGIVCLVIGAGVLALVNLSAEARAVAVGAMCGISATIPVTVLLLFANARFDVRPDRGATAVHVQCVHGVDTGRAVCLECARGNYNALPASTWREV